MLRSLPQTRHWSLSDRLVFIAAFTLITIIAARISIPLQPVPFTLQPLAVLLAGMILGSRDGMLSQLAYIALILANMPVDSRGLGAAAFAGTTGGYLIGFVVAAFVTGWLVERGAARIWQRWLAGVVGVLIIYLFGIPWLKNVTGMSWEAAIAAGAGTFLLFDLAKAVIAAAVTEGGRRLLLLSGMR